MATIQRLNGNWWKYPLAVSRRQPSQSRLVQTSVNNSLYAHPSKPVIALTIDGCDVRHIDRALDKYMPHVLQTITPISHNKLGKGYKCPVSTVFPTCARPNQVSIVTGSTPNAHGIIGDHCIDGDITDSDSLFADSILTELSHANVTVLCMTVNEQIREQITYDFHPNSNSFSLELLCDYANDRASNDNALIESILKQNSRFNRLKELSVYFQTKNGILSDTKGECSLFLLQIMQTMIESDSFEMAQLNYIALSPMIYHYFDDRSPQMMQFMSEIDTYLQCFDRNECRYGVTSAHGSNYKLGAKNELFIVNIGQKLNECWTLFGNEMKMDMFALFEYEIILQSKSTDLLYGFAHIHIMGKGDTDMVDIGIKNKLVLQTLNYLRNIKGIYSSIGHNEACHSLELPSERIGDVILLGDIDTVFCDNLSEKRNNNEWRLSHGSLDESTVPLVLNERPTGAYLTMLGKGKGRNYHLLDILLNGFDDNLQGQCPYKYTPSEYQYVGK